MGWGKPGATDFLGLYRFFPRPSQEQALTKLKLSSLSFGFVLVHRDSFPGKQRRTWVDALPLGTFSSPSGA